MRGDASATPGLLVVRSFRRTEVRALIEWNRLRIEYCPENRPRTGPDTVPNRLKVSAAFGGKVNISGPFLYRFAVSKASRFGVSRNDADETTDGHGCTRIAGREDGVFHAEADQPIGDTHSASPARCSSVSIGVHPWLSFIPTAWIRVSDAGADKD